MNTFSSNDIFFKAQSPNYRFRIPLNFVLKINLNTSKIIHRF